MIEAINEEKEMLRHYVEEVINECLTFNFEDCRDLGFFCKINKVSNEVKSNYYAIVEENNIYFSFNFVVETKKEHLNKIAEAIIKELKDAFFIEQEGLAKYDVVVEFF